jgi:signal transduction histidine kinase
MNEVWWGFIGFDECPSEREWSAIEIDALRTAASTLGAAIQRRANEQERLSLESQVQQTQKLESLGILAGGIAHDFNNLLLGILGNADLALMELRSESPARQHIEDAVKASQRAAELCSQMLAYSGRGTFVLKPLDLSVLVEEMAHLLEVSISKKVALRFNFAPRIPPVEADPTQLRQVVMNLIINASDAIGDHVGQITITTGALYMNRIALDMLFVGSELAMGTYTFLEVADTGCGMDRTTLERIFDPFFTTKFTGRGLGLAAVHGIVRSHHGAIDIDSRVGSGTKFRILLPVTSLPIAEVPSASFKRTERKGSGTILVVDDEEIITDIATKILSQAGFRVLTASDGRKGVEVFCQHSEEIDAVILDLTMPEMSGEEAYGEMILVRGDVKVVLSSGYSESEASTRFAGKNLAGFIQKPYRPNVLIEKLNEILGR